MIGVMYQYQLVSRLSQLVWRHAGNVDTKARKDREGLRYGHLRGNSLKCNYFNAPVMLRSSCTIVKALLESGLPAL